MAEVDFLLKFAQILRSRRTVSFLTKELVLICTFNFHREILEHSWNIHIFSYGNPRTQLEHSHIFIRKSRTHSAITTGTFGGYRQPHKAPAGDNLNSLEVSGIDFFSKCKSQVFPAFVVLFRRQLCVDYIVQNLCPPGQLNSLFGLADRDFARCDEQNM
jgi:hypothetical protein